MNKRNKQLDKILLWSREIINEFQCDGIVESSVDALEVAIEEAEPQLEALQRVIDGIRELKKVNNSRAQDRQAWYKINDAMEKVS